VMLRRKHLPNFTTPLPRGSKLREQPGTQFPRRPTLRDKPSTAAKCCFGCPETYPDGS